MTGTLVTTTGGFVVTERQVPVAALKKQQHIITNGCTCIFIIIMYGQNHLTNANQCINFSHKALHLLIC